MTDHDAKGGPVVATPPEEGGPAHGAGHDHPSDLEYIKVAFFLGAITLAEVGIYYVESLGKALLALILITMSVVKFSVVVMWFMHLRFDSKLFRRFFVTGLILAGFVYGIVLTTFGVWTR